MSLFEQIKSTVDIKSIVEKFHAPVNRNLKAVCPFHHEKTPSLSIDPKEQMFKCFGCGVGGDGIRFVARLKNIEDFEAAKLIIQDFGLSINFDSEFKKSPAGILRAEIQDAQRHIAKTNYFTKRGLTEDTIRNFGLGYDPSKKAVVIPYSSKQVYYQTRGVEDRSFRKPPTAKFGSEPLWFPEVLERNDKTPLFVVESPICAMSLTQYGAVAVALCGTSNAKRWADEVVKRKAKIHGTIVICMDNDKPGLETEKVIVATLKAAKVKHIIAKVDGADDPNDLLQKSANRLCKFIEDAKKEAILASRERKDIISLEKLCQMGIKPKDYIVENMIPESALCMLVAASKVGKSWFVLQMAIAIVEGADFIDEKTKACSVLYYALEDSDERMVSRKNKLTKGKGIPENLYIKMETKTIETGLLEEMEHYISKIPNLKIIIIDTLQLIRGTPRRNEGAYAWDYRELSLLRKFCADNKVTLIPVHHSRKQEDDGDTFNMISGSMGIMGASDATLFIGRKKRMDDTEPYKLSQTGRDVRQCERLIERCEESGRWSKVGNADEQAKKREDEAFNSDKKVHLIRMLLKRQPSGWQGTAGEFIKEGIVLFQESLGREAEIGKQLSNADFKNKLLQRHQIDHEVKHSRKGNVHKFTPFNAYKHTLFRYTDDKDDE